jgi:hypothetical protein
MWMISQVGVGIDEVVDAGVHRWHVVAQGDALVQGGQDTDFDAPA